MDEEYADDGDYDEATADAMDTATRLFAEPTADEEALLQKMKDWAKRARGQRDSKVKQLIAWLKEHLKPGGQWSTERVILFTEYRATQNWLQEVLSVEGFTDGDRLLTMYGGMDSEKREEVKAAFQTSPKSAPSAFCWRPMRLRKVWTFRTSARGSSTTKFLGTRIDWSSATGAWTVTGKRPTRCSSTISSAEATRSGPLVGSAGRFPTWKPILSS